MQSMRRLEIARHRNSSFALLAALPLFGGLACGSETPPAGPSVAGSSAQAGSSGASSAGAGGEPIQAAGSGGAVSGAGGTSSDAGQTGGGTAGSGGSSGDGGSGGSAIDPTTLDKFSFFVTSMVAMRRLSGSQDGFGGDLRYGTDDGLTGADKICTEIAETSMPGSGAKRWRAFLSTVEGPVHAKDRIGGGPWYDRLGRVVAMNLEDLINERPVGADEAIKDDLPNEDGVPNHRPDPNAPPDDNHHMLTGSNANGELYGPTSTCLDWTSSSRNNQMTGRPRIGFSWPIQNRVHWISGQDEGGCGAGVTGVGTVNGGSDPSNPIVGSGGGYGGIYCFALVP